MPLPSRQQFAAFLDATNLKVTATEADIRALCQEAVATGCACVMIYPTSVALAAEQLRGTPVRVGTVVDFPSGRSTTAAKRAEIEQVAADGCHEVDIVMDYARLRAGDEAAVARELAELTARAHELKMLVKVITENCYLSAEEMLAALRLCEAAQVDFIKTSTGFGTSGAKREDVERWAKARTGAIAIKAAGGIKTLDDALAMIDAGATRLGTSSAAALLAELEQRSQ